MGFFLTIEGCEGAGKTTAKGFVLQWLNKMGHPFIETREPGGTPVAERVRDLLLCEHIEKIDNTTELLLVFAARRQNLTQRIEPALAENKVVVCDRFTDATYAYQGGGRGIDTQRIQVLEQLVQGDRRPDLTLLLDVEPELGLSRVKGRSVEKGENLDRIEQETLEFFRRVRSAYLARAQCFPEQYITIDGSQSVPEVEQQIDQALLSRLGQIDRQR